MSQEKTKEAALVAFKRYLKDNGMRQTPERFAILDVIFDFSGHFSLQALHDSLESAGYHVSRSTMFNTISLLTSAGLVRKHTFATESPCYERIAGVSHHHHLICTTCGKIREIKDAKLDEILREKRYGKFYPSQIDINIYGLCAACLRQSRKSTRKSSNKL